MADRRRRRGSLAGRIALATTLAALLAVLIAALVSIGLVQGATQDSGRRVLQQYAGLAVAAADTGRTQRAAVPVRVSRLLEAVKVDVVVVQPDGSVTGPEGLNAAPAGVVTTKQVADLRGGRQFSGERVVSGVRLFVEGRPLSDGGGVVLLERVTVARSLAGEIRRRLLIALVAGLAVAALVGGLLARRLARPLQRAAAAAHRLATGARDVRLQPEGPAEVAEVSEALNTLTGALAASEGRQRDFLLSVSHELRTPLTAVKGYAEALADGVVPAEAVGATGAVVLAEAARLERLVSDLLDLARLGAQDFRIDPAPVDLAELLGRAAVVWSDRSTREGVRFLAEIPATPVTLTTDPTRVRQIVDGLAENALRVTPPGRPIVFALVCTEREVLVQVRDGGPGLTDDDCRVAFERSALYDRYRGVRRVGTGVGLALVAGLAARLGGRAEAGRAPEGGACFTIHLPLLGTPPTRA